MEHISFEVDLWEKGYENIAFCDEVGRGCLFGPVLAAAVIMPKGLIIDGVKDSKKLTHKKREELYEIIKQKAIAIGIGMAGPKTIDEINIKKATRLAMKKAVLSLKTMEKELITPDFILIDAEEIDVNIPQQALIKGEDLSHGIAAASIVAKVIRDRMCIEWDEKYPEYGIGQHKGYGTQKHKEALLKYGSSDLHRKSFLKKIIP
ncbi:ribonuclease HII [Serpentinicella alkaliphila]|uniref:Ribonuclease HII n=1 Tax=Serpentinicella alkaliphila TaxID=1734049 RepID=A0A4R2TSR7_9FIRM|nr:ribonuclease HII [Serpentinicella alkaliphila]QUH26264.1 ribonuclease HII [Serpentinicella alkaliphila]TCQ05842.1 RNase HII [Serpentinicella alkaliphila]